MSLPIFGVGVLNWYPNRNPSEETNRTTGWSSFAKARALDSTDVELCAGVAVAFDGVEKKRKAKAIAAERAMQVMSKREMKMMVVLGL